MRLMLALSASKARACFRRRRLPVWSGFQGMGDSFDDQRAGFGGDAGNMCCRQQVLRRNGRCLIGG
jgi:hypothetical protein